MKHESAELTRKLSQGSEEEATTYGFSSTSLTLYRCRDFISVKRAVASIFETYRNLLPKSTHAKILVKPNLHMDLNSLMGNTTDLRIIISIIEELKKRGYENIVIGDGTNCGMDRFGIDVLGRLGIRAIAHKYHIHAADLNQGPYQVVVLGDGLKAKVADICLNADFFINIPKIKTHRLATMSVALKSLIGCFQKMDKRKIHLALHDNIVKMNEVIRPHLLIVDGLIAKEGQGPAWGKPRRLDVLLAGTSPFLMDAFCARLIGFDLNEIEYLKIAASKGHLVEPDMEKLNEIKPLAYLKRATPQRLVNFLALPMLDPIRNFVRPFTDMKLISKMLYLFRIREDRYVQKDAKIDKMYVDRKACNRCEHCLDFCPMGLPLIQEGFDFEQSDCIKCLYCYFICPQEAIVVEGNLGFIERAAKEYGEDIKKLVAA